MIVVDASALVEYLVGAPAAEAVAGTIFESGESLHAPHLIDLEVAQTLRRLTIGGQAGTERCQTALDDLADLPMRRYPHDILLQRIWELRANMTAYDAAYVALAEELGATLVTRDKRLAAAPGHSARIELI